MINHPCNACGHWMHSSEHLIGLMVRCRECGEPVEVPAKSAPNVPRATQPSGVWRHAPSAVDTSDDPLDQGPVEAGWRRVQTGAARLLPKSAMAYVLAAIGSVLVVAAAALAWWLSHR
jgi:hypothetical protein